MFIYVVDTTAGGTRHLVVDTSSGNAVIATAISAGRAQDICTALNA